MGKDRPSLSIGMPVYNGERFIKATLDSILAQSYENFELVVSDNASTDGTAEICREYQRRDHRIQYHRNQQNLGAAWNYNYVFELSSGEYFKWAASDDLIAPDYLEKCIRPLERDPAIILSYPKTVIISEKGEAINDYDDNLILNAARPCDRYRHYHERFRTFQECNAVFGLIRANALEKTNLIGSFSESDRILLGELTLLGKFHEVPEKLFFRRDHPQASIRAHRSLNERAKWFDPKIKVQFYLPKWKLFFEYISSITRSPIKRSDKVNCYLQMGSWFLWNRKNLINELITGSRAVALRLPRPIFHVLRFLWRLLRAIINGLRLGKVYFFALNDQMDKRGDNL